jgi:hypothetical protein
MSKNLGFAIGLPDPTADACTISYLLLRLVLVRVKECMGLNNCRPSLALHVDLPTQRPHLALAGLVLIASKRTSSK